MSYHPTNADTLTAFSFRFYSEAFALMTKADIPFLVGGAYAFSSYTGITRHTKDLDLFVRPGDVERAIAAFQSAGYRAEIVFTHWLAKAYHGDDFVDLIFSSGNGICSLDEAWFRHAPLGDVFGATVSLMPAEEMIWQKAFIMERERFDGADVNHLLRARGPQLDWKRLVARFGEHWRVLMSHLILFGFVYPQERDCVPGWVMRDFMQRLEVPSAASGNGLMCQGTLLSRSQYLVDTEEWRYGDPRLAPHGSMTAEQVYRWTEAAR